MKVNLQISDGIITGYTTYPIDNRTAIEISKEQLEIIDKFSGFITEKYEVLEDAFLSEKKKKYILNKVQKLKGWFDGYYSVHEQKYRRLIYLFNLGIVNDETSLAEQKLVDLYTQAEQYRLEINKLENDLIL